MRRLDRGTPANWKPRRLAFSGSAVSVYFKINKLEDEIMASETGSRAGSVLKCYKPIL